MIILPLTEEARNGRRIPWVTLTLVVACVVVFLHTGTEDVAVDAEVDAKLDEAWDYFALHPYVTVGPDAALMLGEAGVASVAQTFRLEHQASGSPPIPDFVLHHDQVEFDHLMDEAYTTLETHSFFRFGFFPDTLAAPDETFLTYVFVHEDWLHLLANIALLLLAGIFLEEVFGRALFAVFVATSAVAAAAGYALLDPQAGEALGGASGVAAALAGAFLVRFAGVPIRFRYFYIPPFGGRFTAKGWITLPIYGGFYLLADYLLTHGAPGIEPPETEFATWAHVGGLVWGVGFALILRLLRIEERFIHPRIEQSLVTQSNPMVERALAAREAGQLEEALELLAGEVARHPGNRDACLAYWDAATAAGRPEQATDAAIRVLRDEVTAREKELAVQHWRELTQRVPGARIDAAVEVRVTGFLVAASEIELAVFSAGRILDGHCGAVATPILARLARTIVEIEPALAQRAAEAALDAADLEASDREELDALVARLRGGPDEAQAPATEVTPGEDADDEDSGLFDSDFDLDRHGDSPPLDADSAAQREALESGDALNAAPFELDDTGEDLVGVAAGPAGPAGNPAGAGANPGLSDYVLEGAGPEVGTLASEGAPLDAAAAALDHGAIPLGEETTPPLEPEESAGVLDHGAIPLADTTTSPLEPEESAGVLDHGAIPLGEETTPPPEPEESADALDHGAIPLGEETFPPADSEQAAAAALDEDPPFEPEPTALERSDDDSTGSPAATGPLFADPLDPADLGATQPPALDPPEVVPLAEAAAPASAPESGSALEPEPGRDPELPDVPPVEPLPEPPPTRTGGAEPLDLPQLEAPGSAPRPLKRMDAIPLRLADGSLTLDVGERGKASLGLDRVDAIAVAGVRGLKAKPIVLIDLITNWTSDSSQPLKIVRLRSDRFDPRNLVDATGTGLAALKAWIALLLEESGAMPLPDAASAAGQPFQMQPDLETYEREILGAL